MRENEGKAALRLATRQAEHTRTLARAETERVKFTDEGEAAHMVALAGAEAERITRTGLATTETIARRTEASGRPQIQLTRQIVERIAEALDTSKVDIVPRIQIASGAAGEKGPLGALISMLLAQKGADLLSRLASETT